MELPILIMLNRGTNALYGRHVLKIYVYKNIGHTTALLARMDVLFPNNGTSDVLTKKVQRTQRKVLGKVYIRGAI